MPFVLYASMRLTLAHSIKMGRAIAWDGIVCWVVLRIGQETFPMEICSLWG